MQTQNLIASLITPEFYNDAFDMIIRGGRGHNNPRSNHDSSMTAAEIITEVGFKVPSLEQAAGIASMTMGLSCGTDRQEEGLLLLRISKQMCTTLAAHAAVCGYRFMIRQVEELPCWIYDESRYMDDDIDNRIRYWSTLFTVMVKALHDARNTRMLTWTFPDYCLNLAKIDCGGTIMMESVHPEVFPSPESLPSVFRSSHDAAASRRIVSIWFTEPVKIKNC